MAFELPSTRAMNCTADTLNDHGPGEPEIDGDRRASLATIGHRARRKLRAAALLAAATVWLVQPGQAMAQETRAETIREQQADKQSIVTPPGWNRAEGSFFVWRTGDSSPASPSVSIRCCLGLSWRGHRRGCWRAETLRR